MSEEEELERVVPVVEALAQRFEVFISVDTSKAGVIRESAHAGAHLINDIRSLQEPGARGGGGKRPADLPDAHARAAALCSRRRTTTI